MVNILFLNLPNLKLRIIVIILPIDRLNIILPTACTKKKKVAFSLEDKAMLAHSKKAFPLASLGHSFEGRAYWFVLKAIRVFPIPTQAE